MKEIEEIYIVFTRSELGPFGADFWILPTFTQALERRQVLKDNMPCDCLFIIKEYKKKTLANGDSAFEYVKSYYE